MNKLFTFELETISQLLKWEIARIDVDPRNIHLSSDLKSTLEKIQWEIRDRTKPDES